MIANTHDHARHAHFLAVSGIFKLPGKVRHRLVDGVHYRRKGMIRNVQADQFTFPVQQIAAGDLIGGRRQVDALSDASVRAE